MWSLLWARRAVVSCVLSVRTVCVLVVVCLVGAFVRSSRPVTRLMHRLCSPVDLVLLWEQKLWPGSFRLFRPVQVTMWAPLPRLRCEKKLNRTLMLPIR